jgi:Ser/Thr protein kinase RdoA (MazF antagonist)
LLLTLEDGAELPVVIKRLRPGVKPRGNEREVAIYRRILAGARFGAPALHASVCDDARRRYVLVLEDVGENTLAHADLEDWLAAVRLLGTMHGSYQGRGRELRALGCLGEHDAAHYRRISEAARANLAPAAPSELDRFDRLMARARPRLESLARWPGTLVHGDLYADNVMLQPGGRVRLIDWEEAAIGLGADDLSALIEGWEGEGRELLVDAYLDAVAEGPGEPADRRRFEHLLIHCDILQALRYLGWDAEYCRDPEAVTGLLGTIEDALCRLERAEDAYGC